MQIKNEHRYEELKSFEFEKISSKEDIDPHELDFTW
jgi:hypothetical protein